MAIGNPYASKSTAVDMVMKNPTTARLFSDAMSSPPGSTKRVQLASTLKALEQSGQHFNTQQPSSSFPFQQAQQAHEAQSINSAPVVPQEQTAKYEDGQLKEFSSTAVTGAPATPAPEPVPVAPAPAPTQPSGDFSWLTPDIIQAVIKAADKLVPATDVSSTTLPSPKQEVPTVTQKLPTIPGETTQTQLLASKPVTPTTPSSYKNVTNISKGYTPTTNLENEINAAGGKEAWIQTVMADPDLLQKTLGMTKEQIAATYPGFKAGVLEKQQLLDLAKTNAHAQALEAQRQRLLGIQNRGGGVKDFMQDYIRGKDTILKTLDGLINRTNDTAKEMDMTDPANRQSYDRYMGYLTTLKGAQNERYIDFVNSGIEKANNDIKVAQENYKILEDQVTKELVDTKEVTKEVYKQIEDKLKSMADNVDEQRKKAKEVQDANWEKIRRAHESAQWASDGTNTPVPADTKKLFTDTIKLSLSQSASPKISQKIYDGLLKRWQDDYNLSPAQFDKLFKQYLQ